MASNDLNTVQDPPQWNSEPMFQLPSWGEPLIVFSILVASMIVTRRKGFRILGKKKTSYDSLLDEPSSPHSSDELLCYDADSDEGLLGISKHYPKRRRCCGTVVRTPNTSRFASNIHSRILMKFPFLIEMFYWIITYIFYRLTKIVSTKIFSKIGIWDVAMENGVRLLEIEEESWLRIFFPLTEHNVQAWFMNGHQVLLTVLNRFYALVHIPGTVGFIAWYYYVAPSHNTFATARRTLTLTNLFAFVTFTFYPCMPPRLLPKEYGFLDTVRHDNAQSIWMSGDYVNSLAAMPSMHFGYSFVIGCVLLYHSGIFRRTLEKGETRMSRAWQIWYLFLAVAYPLSILITIVATANHYWLDAVVAVFVAFLAFLCNKIFIALLPLEDLLLWALRLEKPTPSTGERYRNERM
ncbi:hypothetical protein DTO164E3_4433 [Paecilomyces variotii]|nr:hypothetical protein DTO164E3_4433 [Paecilomyces variotii]KAJ9226838.1 hypothetical protein DTO169C6_593 [Paecilomyces variotii]KAJ9228559.1 hypothetical protein DTO166G5_8477 [Paecilomyces variotii]KAJ9272230.1 hypothetical protein DTO212C5_1735 [Paecilomyces variotii]KAJ9290764.1 hypothetical protein DTO021C3_1698 [Paecilomyces variotii]